MKSKKIAVLMGGNSTEREISLLSGQAVLEALKRKGYDATGVDTDRNIAGTLRAMEIDAAFIALHGAGGEDGKIQGMLESMGIPYTGSSVEASVVGMNKWLTKLLLVYGGIPTPAFVSATSLDGAASAVIAAGLAYPLVVKPVTGGSTIGIGIAAEQSKLPAWGGEALKFDSRVIIETFIPGREISVGVMDDTALPVIEIRPKSGFYDYEAKYTRGMTEYDIPAVLDRDIYRLLQQTAVEVHTLLGCRGVTRIDFRLSRENVPYVLEINTIPGMTQTSLVPKMAQYIGIDYDSFVEKILLSALPE